MNRVVTGFDENGNPVVIRQGDPPVVIHAGRYTTTELSECGAPRLTVSVDGQTPSVLSQYVLVLPSTALAAT